MHTHTPQNNMQISDILSSLHLNYKWEMSAETI